MDVDLELHQLDLKYDALRVADEALQSRLVASLVRVGQKSPVLVVEVADRFVLIDGYRRVAASRVLGRDTIRALVLSMSEVDALILSYGLQRHNRKSALEEAWLLRELNEGHGLSQVELAARFERSVSWVSRRLALVRDLPQATEKLVRDGAVTAQAAMKYLVPLARAKPEQAEKLAQGLQGTRLTTRQVGKLYAAWRSGNPSQKRAVVEQPLLHLRVLEELETVEAEPLDASAEQLLERELSVLAGACWRAHRVYQESRAGRAPLVIGAPLLATWRGAEEAFHALQESLVEETRSASPVGAGSSP